MYTLGLSAYSHESSAVLLRDGKIIAMGEEERFTREKHTWRYPRNGIQYCLDEAGIKISDVNHIAFFWQPLREVFGNLWQMARFFPGTLNLLKAPSGGEELGFRDRVKAMAFIGRELQEQFSLNEAPKIHFIEHHLCHAASAFFVSPFENAAILTLDGRGERTSAFWGWGKGNEIQKIKEIKLPHSLGHFYAAVTAYLGFRPFFDEWKVMGLSAYGKPKYLKDFAEMIELRDDGTFRLNLDYFSFHTHGDASWLSPKFYKQFGPYSWENAADIAYALQKTVENAGVHLANGLYRKTNAENLCIAGGVALNCLMNKRIIEETPFKKVFIQPIANDAGTSLGAALYHYHQIEKKNRGFTFDRVYWGPEFSNDEIESVLKRKNISYKKSANIAADAATEIAAGKIVGWFQGRMECGPRALGNRSITVDPTDPGMKGKLNLRVKRRENFRPFAPSVLAERSSEYFQLPKNQPSPYMILAGDVRKERRSEIPAVTHVDGTARVHTVEKEINPSYWTLIHEFEKIKGVPILLNTSFNESEPIVCSPDDAIACFLRAELEVLAIGDFLVTKREL